MGYEARTVDFMSHLSFLHFHLTGFCLITFTGYRLAFNYLKAKRLVDAIDVCHKVFIMNFAP